MSASTVKPNRSLAAWKVAGFVGRLLVGGLFIFAAYNKILDPLKFAEEIQAYELAPLLTTNAIAIVLPWVELVAGVLLIAGFWRAEARLLIFAMMVVFITAKITVEARGLDINCGCWGNDWMESTFRDIRGILLDLVLIGLLVVDYYGQSVARAAVRAAKR